MKHVMIVLLAFGMLACDSAATQPSTLAHERAAQVRSADVGPSAIDGAKVAPVSTRKPGRLMMPAITSEAQRDAYMARLSTEPDAPTRAAIVRTLAHDAAAHPVLAAQFLRERDVQVRVALLAAMRTADVNLAAPLVRGGFSDADPSVRRAAAGVAGARADGHAFVPELVAALRERDEAVVAAVAEACGLLSAPACAPGLFAVVNHSSADVRLQALRALLRIHAAGARADVRIRALRDDADPRVRRLARTLQ